MTDPNTAVLARIRQMIDAWEQRLPETISTATAVEALRMAMEPAAVEPPADQTAESVRAQLLHALDFSACLNAGYGGPEELLAAYDASRTQASADETPATEAATPDETDEQRADREETERDHARGDHTYCGVTCEVTMPTEQLRNFVVAKGYPGTNGALNELLRRAKSTPLDVLRCLADPEACRWEGVYCITHSWKSDIGRCPHGQAQALLGGGR